MVYYDIVHDCMLLYIIILYIIGQHVSAYYITVYYFVYSMLTMVRAGLHR